MNIYYVHVYNVCCVPWPCRQWACLSLFTSTLRLVVPCFASSLVRRTENLASRGGTERRWDSGKSPGLRLKCNALLRHIGWAKINPCDSVKRTGYCEYIGELYSNGFFFAVTLSKGFQFQFLDSSDSGACSPPRSPHFEENNAATKNFDIFIDISVISVNDGEGKARTLRHLSILSFLRCWCMRMEQAPILHYVAYSQTLQDFEQFTSNCHIYFSLFDLPKWQI